MTPPWRLLQRWAVRAAPSGWVSARCFPPFVVAGLLFVIEILMSFRTQRSVWCLVAFVYLVVYRPDLKGYACCASSPVCVSEPGGDVVFAGLPVERVSWCCCCGATAVAVCGVNRIVATLFAVYTVIILLPTHSTAATRPR